MQSGSPACAPPARALALRAPVPPSPAEPPLALVCIRWVHTTAEEGYVPATSLALEGTPARMLADFEGDTQDELAVPAGAEVMTLEPQDPPQGIIIYAVRVRHCSRLRDPHLQRVGARRDDMAVDVSG